jgi:hypothetical protein
MWLQKHKEFCFNIKESISIKKECKFLDEVQKKLPLKCRLPQPYIKPEKRDILTDA